MTPLFILVDVLRGLGLGEQIIVAAIVGLFLMYLFRAKSAAGRATSAAATAWMVTIGVGTVITFALIFGWVDPNPIKFVEDVTAFGQDVARAIFGPVSDYITSFMP